MTTKNERVSPWDGKVILITGGSSGIGLAAARQLAAHGAHLFLLARDPQRLAGAVAETRAARRSTNQLVEPIAADVADPQQANQAVLQVAAAIAAPDVVINSAGVVHPGYVETLSIERFHWMMEINYFGTVHMVQAALPAMLARGSGRIINISSGAGLVGVFGYAAYGPTKSAIINYSGILRSELKARGIQVHVVLPPDTDTPQLAYENQFKPIETKIIAGNVKPMTADGVATAMLRQAAKGRLVILPNFDIWLTYTLTRLFGASFYPFMDWLIARGKKAGHS